MPASLEDVRIKCLPSNAYYVSSFISEDEEKALLNKIAAAPKPRWKQLSRRRLQTWPSDLTNNTLLESPLPSWLVDPIIPRITSYTLDSMSQTHIFSDSPHGLPNHVLINEYLPGQGIMPHKDGSAYHPVVCTVSLGASLCLDLYATKEDGMRETKPKWRIFQEPRSLLITTGELYTDFLHGIADATEEVDLRPTTIANWGLLSSPETIISGEYKRQTRTSLTYRDVLKVSKLGAKFGIFGKR
jgi:alkylated DNA repair protein alkB family protein 6